MLYSGSIVKSHATSDQRSDRYTDKHACDVSGWFGPQAKKAGFQQQKAQRNAHECSKVGVPNGCIKRNSWVFHGPP
jgi:hypothetical protein